jgi:hypothetical protein
MATKTTSTKTAKTQEIAKTDDGLKPMSATEARNLTTKIRTSRHDTIKHAVEAFTKRIWLSLHDTEGKPYKGWKDYADNELGGFQISVSSHDRPAIVGQLHDAGASQAIIASITGTTQQTVSNDIKWVESQRVTNNLSPDDNITDTTGKPLRTNGEPVPAATSVGVDNKEYPRSATKPHQQKSTDQDVIATAKKIATRLDTLNDDIDKLFKMPGARESVEVERLLRNRIESLSNAVEMYMLPTKVTA